MQIMNQSDRILIRKIVGEYGCGIFSIGMTVSYVVWILGGFSVECLDSWLYEKIAREEADEVEKPWTIVMHMFGLLILATGRAGAGGNLYSGRREIPRCGCG